jgi:hypothetical protein
MVDIKEDMSALYDEVRDGTRDLKVAAEMANIAGKFLKAEQLILAREVFLSGASGQPRIPAGGDRLVVDEATNLVLRKLAGCEPALFGGES